MSTEPTATLINHISLVLSVHAVSLDTHYNTIGSHSYELCLQVSTYTLLLGYLVSQVSCITQGST